MKCSTCNAEIKTGNLYCSCCGAEVQIVSAEHVLEEEFFRDFRNPELLQHISPTINTTDLSKQKKRLLGMLFFVFFSCLFMIASTFYMRSCLQEHEQKVQKPMQLEVAGYLASNDEAMALHAVEAYSKKHETEKDALFWKAWLYERQGLTAKQTQTLQQILALDKDDIYACRELIWIYIQENDFESFYRLQETCESGEQKRLFERYAVDAPTIELPQEPINTQDMLTIAAQEGLNIYYTLDDSSPISNGILYYAPIRMESGTYTIKAVACNEDGYFSRIVSEHVSVEQYQPLGMPQVSPDSGEYPVPQTIYIQVPDGCTAYYTWNGTTPTTSSRKYKGSIAMPEGNNVLSVILVDEYGNISSVQRVNYIYMPN